MNGIQEVGGSTPPGSTTRARPPRARVTPRSGAPVLVTGGAGYIGAHVVLALRGAGYPVVVLDDLSTGRAEAVPDGAAFVAGDAGDAALVGGLLAERGVGAVVHLAASASVPESVRDPLRYWRNNAAATANLLHACAAADVRRFVFSSTAAVYGIPRAVPVDEDAPTAPINPYGASKLAAEWMLRDAAAAHGMRYVALRYFNVAGADPDGRAGQRGRRAEHLITVACDAALGLRDGVAVFGSDYDTEDGTGVRDYIHVADLAEAHVAALRHLEDGGAGGTFNCGYGRGYSVREALAAVEREAGVALRVRDAPRRPGDPPALVADAARIRAALGWSPRRGDLGLIVRDALRWRRRLEAESRRPPGRRERTSGARRAADRDPACGGRPSA